MKIKKYLKSILISIAIIIGGIMFVSILNYFSILSKTLISILKLLTIFISLAYSGYTLGRNANKKGYLEGVKAGGIIILLLIIYNLIIHNSFGIKNIIYYFILLSISTISSMIGISRKKETI